MNKKPCTFIVLSNPVPGKEDAYNEWYSQRHLRDVLRVPGFTSARRFRANAVSGGGTPAYQYLAIYEAVTEQPKEMLDEVLRRAGGPDMPISEGMSPDFFAVAYEPITDVIEAEAE